MAALIAFAFVAGAATALSPCVLPVALSRLVPTPQGGQRGDGFGPGVLVGLSLGVVYAPCVGPILAGLITVSASQPLTAGRL